MKIIHPRYTLGNILIGLAIFILCTPFASLAQAQAQAQCKTTDRLCLMAEIKTNADNIKNESWRDKAYRELAKSYTYDGYEDKAIALIDLIKKPDTKAMTIRGIGMAAANNEWKNKKRYDVLFKNLALEAEKIKHPPSYAIAYTYIAMSQAFANDNEGAMATARGMENDALRHKAFAEIAEIQAERGDFKSAMKSIEQIQSTAFKNKAYATIARIFIKTGSLDHAYLAAQKIDNFYAKAQILQNIINFENKEENLLLRGKM